MTDTMDAMLERLVAAGAPRRAAEDLCAASIVRACAALDEEQARANLNRTFSIWRDSRAARERDVDQGYATERYDTRLRSDYPCDVAKHMLDLADAMYELATADLAAADAGLRLQAIRCAPYLRAMPSAE